LSHLCSIFSVPCCQMTRTGRSRRLQTDAPPPRSCCPRRGDAFCRLVERKAGARQRHHASREKARKATPLNPWTVHDLRRTVATGLQRLGVRLEVTETVLNHISGSRGGIAGVYQRHDWANEKRAALDAWAAHVLAVVERRTPADNVVKLTRVS